MTDNSPAVRTAPKVEIDDAKLALQVIAGGNLENLSDQQKGELYLAMCEATGLNPAFRPFGIIETKQGHKFYAFKSATDQLRKLNNLNVINIEREIVNNDALIVTVTMQDQNGRMDQDVGVVSIKGQGGEYLANAYMRAYTKAKRRCTLGIAGLGILDESEIETIPGARIIDVTDMPTSGNVSHETPAAGTDARTKAMAKFHANGKEIGYDHEALSKLAYHVYPVSSLTELTEAQIKTLSAAVDQNSGDVDGAIDAVYTAHALGVDAAKQKLKAGMFGTSQKKMVNDAIKLVTQISSGLQLENDTTVTPTIEEPVTEDAPVQGREVVEVVSQATGEIIEIEQEHIGTIDNTPQENLPSSWTELWGFFKQNGVKNMPMLTNIIGPIPDGATPEEVYASFKQSTLQPA